MNSVSDRILRRIRAKQRGWVFTPKDFIDLTNRNAIGIILHRLAKKGIIRKLGHGLYDFPTQHPKLGTFAADPHAIAKALAARTGDTIQPSGAALANQLGLDSQVPAKPVYLTSGHSLLRKIANYEIRFQHSKLLPHTLLNTNVVKVLNALHHLGKNNIDDHTIKKCQKILSKKDKTQLKNNLNKLPNWMITVILRIVE